MRCVFSETLKVRTLDAVVGTPPSPHWVEDAQLGSLGWRKLPSFAHTVLHHLINDTVATVFPGDCRVCGGSLLRAGLVPVCDGCLHQISIQTTALCRLCGEALDVDLESDRFLEQEWVDRAPSEGLLCSPCRLAPPPFERAVAFGLYADAMREMIHLLKYERLRAVARPLGAMLAQAMATLQLTGDVTVIAVPLYPAKQRQRGYNQAVLLADEAAARLGQQSGLTLLARHSVLRRQRDTESQFSLTPRGRRANLRGAFNLAEDHELAGRTVLLVDDIYTTGATARECARVLRRAGAARVLVATLSRAQPEQATRWNWHTNGSSENGGS